MFASKGLWLTAGLYAAMIGLAVLGYWRWRQAAQRMPMSQVQSYFLEGMRPELSHMNFSVPSNVRNDVSPQIQTTKTIRHDVNLKKSTLRLVRDAAGTDRTSTAP